MTKTCPLMKNAVISSLKYSRFLCKACQKRKFTLSAIVGAAMLAAISAPAANLLVNPGFESNSGHVIPSGWTRFAPPTAAVYGDYATEGIVTNQAGSTHYKEWG